ncbi:MAG: Mut7-C RNAse domain-containing protein [Bacillota bacterium]
MKCCSVRFYAELNDFLPAERRQVAFTCSFSGQPTIKDLVESLGVPHTEVDLILQNGESVDFYRRVQNGDRISVYPVFETIDLAPVLRVRPAPLRKIRFVLDVHLGRLATYLRMAGFDALYNNEFRDDELVRISVSERRILLTRDRGLLKRSEVTHGYYVRATDPPAQLAEVLRRFDLFRAIQPFRRCLRCNETLEPVPKDEAADRLPPKVRESCAEFFRCRHCGRIYWKGTHYKHMKSFLDQIQNLEGTR